MTHWTRQWIYKAKPRLLRTFWGNAVVVALASLLAIGAATQSPPANWLVSVSCVLLPCLSSVEIKDNDALTEIEIKGEMGWSELVELSVRDNDKLEKVSLICLRNLRTLTIASNEKLNYLKLSGLHNLQRLLIKDNDNLAGVFKIEEITESGCADPVTVDSSANRSP